METNYDCSFLLFSVLSNRCDLDFENLKFRFVSLNNLRHFWTIEINCIIIISEMYYLII